ncbi:MAG TPA: biotin-dependent carboxyltransferase family protein [Gemmatimonadales bacterium]
MIVIEKAPPFSTVQDLGWRAGRAIGLPRSGAMDPALLGVANTLVGNPPGAAAIEWALGAGAIQTDRGGLLAVLGADEVRVDGEAVDPGHPVIHAAEGTRISIVPRTGSRFLYVAVHGGIDVPPVMGSRSTYLPGGFGGFQGRRLQAGDQLPVGPAAPIELGSTVHPRSGIEPGPSSVSADVTIRAMPGPQWERFDESARRTLFESRYVVTAASDRMGYRLEGPLISPRESATLPSEAACPGAIQIPDGGQPIVLMPDGPTVGGYPKIAVVRSADLRLLAQCVAGRGVRATLAD